jgi:hypothetical protein
MIRCGHRALCLIATLTIAPLLFAQQTQEERIRQLESKLDELLRQAGEIRQEIDALKAPSPQAAQTTPPDDDLTKIEVVTPPAAPVTETPSPAETPAAATPSPSAAPSLADVQTVANVPNPGASKVFNPDTSVVGNFIGHAGRTNAFDPREPLQLEEAEVAFEAFVDPYAKAKFFLAAGPEGVEIEEGYAQFITLPADLTAKAGKFKAQFGKANTWHTHVRPWVDQPLVIHNFFGDEQLADSGVSVSKLFPNSFAVIEATAEVLRGNVEGVFDRDSSSDLATNAHLRIFRDLSEDANVELGTSFAQGTIGAGRNRFGGFDLTYRWKPLHEGLTRGLIARFEGVVDDRADAPRDLRGFYASVDYQLARRWFGGVRLDAADRPGSSIQRDRGASATLTFRPSEFSQIRGQLRRTRYGRLHPINEFLLQLQFAIGAHGAHTF